MLKSLTAKNSAEEYFILISSESCAQCARFKEALVFLESNDQLPAPIFIEDATDAAMREIVIKYNINEIPTFIHFRNDTEIKRWAGFFDGDLISNAHELHKILENQIIRGHH